MLRGHFLLLASSLQGASAIVTDVIGAALEQPTSFSSTQTEFTVSLTLQRYLYTGPNNLQQYTRAFNNELTGPTIRIKPGDTLHIELTNGLSAEAFDTSGLHNNFKDFDTTNLHTHGLHIHGTAPGDSIFTVVNPGQKYTYTYQIPSNHEGGTFWYHPHHHGSTAIQAGGGAAGMIIVEDAANLLPASISALEEVILVLSHLDMASLTAVGTQYETNCQNAGGSVADCNEDTWSDGAISGTQVNLVVVNGMYQPTISMAANRWYRWRMVFAAVNAVLEPMLTGCEIKLLAKDGVYLSPAPRDITTGYMGPGNRADWIVRCPAGSYSLFSNQIRRRKLQGPRPAKGPGGGGLAGGGAGNAPFTQLLATVVVTDQGDSQCTLPTFEVNRPCYLVDLRSATASQTVNFRLGPAPTINGASFVSSTTYAASMPVGNVIQYDLNGVDAHPFHNHVNSFQLLEDPADTANNYFRAGDWHDVLISPNGVLSVRLQTDKWVGTQVFHCHILEHEDEGMMGATQITGTEGTLYSVIDEYVSTGVNESSVTVTVTAASTRIVCIIDAADQATADSLLATVSPSFADNDATTITLGFAVISSSVSIATVSVATAVPFLPPPPSPLQPPASSDDTVVIAAIAGSIGGAFLLVLVGFLCFKQKNRRDMKPTPGGAAGAAAPGSRPVEC
ncbi:hypothetical protein AB1Y20_003443 [Prymnesium parvum]|uniref:Laccase n=1 Tax=Prymnesium parvum TaxID=97485 RepID=A0AB34JD17_PRYPA